MRKITLIEKDELEKILQAREYLEIFGFMEDIDKFLNSDFVQSGIDIFEENL